MQLASRYQDRFCVQPTRWLICSDSTICELMVLGHSHLSVDYGRLSLGLNSSFIDSGILAGFY